MPSRHRSQSPPCVQRRERRIREADGRPAGIARLEHVDLPHSVRRAYKFWPRIAAAPAARQHRVSGPSTPNSRARRSGRAGAAHASIWQVDLPLLTEAGKDRSHSRLLRDILRVELAIPRKAALHVEIREAPEIRRRDAAVAIAETVVALGLEQDPRQRPVADLVELVRRAAQRVLGAFLPAVRRAVARRRCRATRRVVHGPRAQRITVVEMPGEPTGRLPLMQSADQEPRHAALRGQRLVLDLAGENPLTGLVEMASVLGGEPALGEIGPILVRQRCGGGVSDLAWRREPCRPNPGERRVRVGCRQGGHGGRPADRFDGRLLEPYD